MLVNLSFQLTSKNKNEDFRIGIDLANNRTKQEIMIVTENKNKDDKEWEVPLNPESAKDARDVEQIERLHVEAQRLKDNLTEKDHIDKVKKN